MDCKEIVFSRHAIIQMFARKISKDQVVKVIHNGEVIADYKDDKPLPSKLIFGIIYNKPLHVVVGYNDNLKKCIVITAYFPDAFIWEPDFKTRRKK